MSLKYYVETRNKTIIIMW